MDPITVAIVDDYDVVVNGVARMLAPFPRLRIVHARTGSDVREPVDVVLFDTFGQSEAHGDDVDVLLANPCAERVAVFTWNLARDLVRAAVDKGVAGYLAKSWPAERLAEAIVAIHAGEVVVPDEFGVLDPDPRDVQGPDWPGRDEGLSPREAQVLALLVDGLTNAEIGQRLYISVNSVKTHVRNVYAKIGVSSRAQAVLWGVDHGFRRQQHALDGWLG